jgi:hypothetical protein
MQKQINSLVHKEMTRKEFLGTVGFGLLSLAGMSTIVKLLGGSKTASQHAVGAGYGSSAYGG